MSGPQAKVMTRFASGRRLGLALAVGATLSASGCTPKPKPMPLTPPVVVPTVREVAQAHNERVTRLATTFSDGVIELRWSDSHGKHSEQGDLDFWQAGGDRTALRISKVGQPLFWLGSDANTYWFFDLMNKDDHVLYTGNHDAAAARVGAFGVRPLALLDLLALTPIDPGVISDQPVQIDESGTAWMIESPGRGGVMRLHFDRRTLLPSRVESLDGAGTVVVHSSLSRYESVQASDTAVMALPKMAEIIDIEREERIDGELAGTVKIAINTTTGIVEPKTLERVFDLQRLIGAMRPVRIEGQSAPE